jgi:hypothetical protein
MLAGAVVAPFVDHLMNAHQTWKHLFSNWPAGIPRRGVIINTLNEPVPFKSFLIKDEVLLLERTNPDAMGARYVLLGYDTIHSLRFTDPLKESVIAAAGFVGNLAKA